MSYRFSWVRFKKLHAMLKELESDSDNIDLLSELQIAIIQYVKRDERRLTRLKIARKRLNAQRKAKGNTKEQSIALKQQLEIIDEHIELLRAQVFHWRSFGDAIAYLYLDDSAIKTLYFDLDTQEPRRTAGFMSGKKGHRLELKILRYALSRGIPSLLTDATNVLRYGDICLMKYTDPLTIEIKSSKHENERGRKQESALRRIHEFLATDQTPSLRSLGPVERLAISSNETTYKDVVDEAVSEAILGASKTVSLEEGMTLLVVRDPNDIKHLMDAIPLVQGDRLAITFWSDSIHNRDWLPCSPPLLVFDKMASIESIMKEETGVIVVVNLDAIVRHAKSYGLDIAVLEDPNYVFEISEAGTDVSLPETLRMRMSYFLFNRASYELKSCESLIKESWQAIVRKFKNLGDE